MKKVFCILALLWAFNSYAVPKCPSEKHPLYCTIVELKPSINKSFAFRMSNLIYRYSRIYKTDPYRTIAIIMQESGFRNIHVPGSVYVPKDDITIEGLKDLGLYQMNVSTIQHYGFDPAKIIEDLEYATECHFKILKRKIKLCKNLGKDSWTCYHSKTPFYRENYKKLVNRYYRGGANHE